MEAILKIPLDDYLDPEELKAFTRRCADDRVTIGHRVSQLIKADISDPSPAPAPQPKEEVA